MRYLLAACALLALVTTPKLALCEENPLYTQLRDDGYFTELVSLCRSMDLDDRVAVANSLIEATRRFPRPIADAMLNTNNIGHQQAQTEFKDNSKAACSQLTSAAERRVRGLAMGTEPVLSPKAWTIDRSR